MADEPQKLVTAAPPELEPIVEPTPEEPTPHPLHPGGARFEEVYARMKQAEERAARMEGALAQAQQQHQLVPQQSQFIDPAQLQALVDQGRITPMQAADVLSRQNAQHYATQTTLAAVQAQQLNTKIQSAATEVNQYIDKLPVLRDTNSAEFGRVRDEAYRLAEDMNLPVQDFRVQRAALRATFGSLERMASASQARQQSREASLPHTETTVGSRATTPAAKGADPLKDIDPTYLDYWQRKGYSRERMIEEAQYIPKGRKVRTGSGARA